MRVCRAESVRELGIEIRTGVHFGECEQVGDKLGGMAVVVGARVMSLGGPGDVLVTASTSDLVAGAGLGFQDRGTHSLKGVDGRWHVLAVSEVDGAPRSSPAEPEEAEQRLAEVQPSAPRSRTWQVVATVAAFVVLAALVAVPLLAGPGKLGDRPELDRHHGPGLWRSPLDVGARDPPGSIAASADDVWVTNPDVGTVTRIDSNEQDDRDPIQVGENPTGIAVGGNVVWVVESGGPSVSRISPDTNFVEGDPIEVGNGPAGVAVGEGRRVGDQPVRRDDLAHRPDSGEVVDDPGRARPARDRDRLQQRMGGAGGVEHSRADRPSTNRAVPPIPVGERTGVGHSERRRGMGRNALDDTVMRINPDTNSVVDTVPVGEVLRRSRPKGGSVGRERSGRDLSRIEPGRRRFRTIVIGSIPQGLADVGETCGSPSARRPRRIEDGTLRLVSDRTPVDSLDSTVGYDVPRGACCTCSGTVWSRSSQSEEATPRSCPIWHLPYRNRRTKAERMRSRYDRDQYSNGEVV